MCRFEKYTNIDPHSGLRYQQLATDKPSGFTAKFCF